MIRRTHLVAAAVLLALLGPAGARAATGESLTTVRAYDVPLHGERSLAAVATRSRFDLVGVHWQGSGSVDVRVRSSRGRWGPWVPVEGGDGPDPGTAEAKASTGWHVGEGLWVGGSTGLEVRPHGTVRRARAWTVRSPVSRVPLRRLTTAGAPPVVTRAQWLVDESLRRGDPQIAPVLRFAVVHHTAGPNSYTREQAPAVVRAIMAYHVQANGWNDIGYNALVDRFGTVYEGRYGGLDRNVIGAHARGFNTGSFGIALLGEFTASAPPKAALDGVARMLAWRFDLAHVDPLSTLQVVSGGSERFPPGIPVALRAISGHRDTGLTACPGNRLYALLPALAAQVAAIGLPKIYEPSLAGTWGAPLTLTARLSGPLAWTATLTRPDGSSAATSTGKGPTVSATWDTAGLPEGAYTWRIAVPGATPAIGTIGTPAVVTPVAFEGATATPDVISPDGDGSLDATTITYRLTSAATVTATVVDTLGVDVATLEPARWRRAGEHAIAFDGLGLSDGVVSVRLDARGADGSTATTTVRVAISRTLAKPSLTTPVFTPNGDGHTDVLGVRFALTADADVRLRILRLGVWVTTPFSGPLAAGAQLLEWDGAKRTGRLREGAYTAELEVTDGVATTRVSLPFLADWTAPAVSVVSTSPPRLRVSEPAVLRVVVNGLWRRLDVRAAGTVALPWVKRIRTLLVVARDAAGNVAELRRPPG